MLNPRSTPCRQKKRGLTIYLEPEVHSALKDVAEREGKWMQELLLEGVGLVLRHYGRQAAD
jgi:hypothetical protein